MTTSNRNQDRKPQREAQGPAFIAWYAAERGEKSFWTRIGAAWNHEDAKGLTLQLELMPVSGGRIILRAPSAGDGEPADGRGA